MRQFLLGLSVSGAFIVGCVTGSIAQRTAEASPDNAPAEEVVPAYPRWEYLCDRADWRLDKPGHAQALNGRGAEGWELVTASDGGFRCFKRPL